MTIEPVLETVETPTPAAAPTEDWEKRFKGLQRANQTLQQQLQAMQAAIAPLAPPVEADAKPKLEDQLAAVVAKVADLENRLHREKLDNRKLQLLGAKAPQFVELAEFIPTLEDPTAQENAVLDFAQRVQAIAAKVVVPASGDAAPPQPPKTPPTSRTTKPAAPETVDAEAALAKYNAGVLKGLPESDLADLRALAYGAINTPTL